VTLAADTPQTGRIQLLAGALRELGRAVRRRSRTDATVLGTEEALVRALCHDMRSPLVSLEAVLAHLDRPAAEGARAELLELARAQTEHLSSMLRTAVATGGAVQSRGIQVRRLADVLDAATAAAGLPVAQLSTVLTDGTEAVQVADARVQRIVTNLLENAHRHGDGAPVLLHVGRDTRWVELLVTQAGVPDAVVGHLNTASPPQDLTGLGLWSVRRQTIELGGELAWRREPGGDFTFVVRLPDR
jgi:signal transduction histidine kinase